MNAPTPIADMITEMLKNCIPMETIIMAVRSMERALSTRRPPDEIADKRRAWDREYRRRKRGMSANPPDIHPKPPDVGDSALFVIEETLSIKKEAKKERKSVGAKLPPDWKPKEKHYVEGANRGMSRREVDERATAMRDWCEANANRSITTKANWDAAFMGAWLKQGNRNGGSNGKTAGTSSVNAAWDQLIEGTSEHDRDEGEDAVVIIPPRPIRRP